MKNIRTLLSCLFGSHDLGGAFNRYLLMLCKLDVRVDKCGLRYLLEGDDREEYLTILIPRHDGYL